MIQDEIIRMAREAGLPPTEWVFNFAALVADHEREAILEIVKTIGGEFAVECAAAIRARGNDAE